VQLERTPLVLDEKLASAIGHTMLSIPRAAFYASKGAAPHLARAAWNIGKGGWAALKGIRQGFKLPQTRERERREKNRSVKEGLYVPRTFLVLERLEGGVTPGLTRASGSSPAPSWAKKREQASSEKRTAVRQALLPSRARKVGRALKRGWTQAGTVRRAVGDIAHKKLLEPYGFEREKHERPLRAPSKIAGWRPKKRTEPEEPEDREEGIFIPRTFVVLNQE